AGFAEQADLEESDVLVEQRGRLDERHHLVAVEPDFHEAFLRIARPEHMHDEIVPLPRRQLSLAGPVPGVRHPRGEEDVLTLHFEGHELPPSIAGFEVTERVAGVAQLLGYVNAPGEVTFGSLGGPRRFGLVL